MGKIKIQMCIGSDAKGDCPNKDDCMRYILAPDGGTDWLANLPYNFKLDECKFYLPEEI